MKDFMKLFSLLSLVAKLAALLESLKGIRASNPATGSADYALVAEQILQEASTEKFLARLSPTEQASLRSNLPAFLFWLDYMSEKV
jgi:hypothetical protein